MTNQRKALIVVGIAVLVAGGALFRNYTEALNEKNAIERERIESNERLKTMELEQEKRIEQSKRDLDQAKLDRELEEDCQKQISVMRLRFNNVEGGGYNAYEGYCEVSYRDTESHEIEKANIKNMASVK